MTFEEYKALIDEIDYHMNRYYNDNEPEISDFEYDQLMLKLKGAEKSIRIGSHRILRPRKSAEWHNVRQG